MIESTIAVYLSALRRDTAAVTSAVGGVGSTRSAFNANLVDGPVLPAEPVADDR